jgi:hypothetical protein
VRGFRTIIHHSKFGLVCPSSLRGLRTAIHHSKDSKILVHVQKPQNSADFALPETDLNVQHGLTIIYELLYILIAISRIFKSYAMMKDIKAKCKLWKHPNT